MVWQCLLRPLIAVMAFLPITMADLYATLNYDQFLQSTPKVFGLYLIPVADYGEGEFGRRVDEYAMMQCQLMAEIIVFVDAQAPVQSQKDTNWRRPVIFVQSRSVEQANFYMLPEDSGVGVYFILAHDVMVSCEQMSTSFALWREKAIGDLAPLMSYQPKGFDFQLKSSAFVLDDPGPGRFYHFAQINACWVSRFYLQLLNSRMLQQVQGFLQVARSINDCYDVALNFITSHYFPQLVCVALNGDVKHPKPVLPPARQPLRDQCMQKFTDTLGYNPLRLANRADPPNTGRWVSHAMGYVLYLRRYELDMRMRTGTHNLVASQSNQYDTNQNRLREQLVQFKKQISIARQQYIEIQKQRKYLQGNKKNQKIINNNQLLNQNTVVSKQKLAKIDLIKYLTSIILIILSLLVLYITTYYCCAANGLPSPRRRNIKQVIPSSDEEE